MKDFEIEITNGAWRSGIGTFFEVPERRVPPFKGHEQRRLEDLAAETAKVIVRLPRSDFGVSLRSLVAGSSARSLG